MSAPDHLSRVPLHPEFPEKVWVVVEQPGDEPSRLAYDPLTNGFVSTRFESLGYARGFRGAYGWVGGLGTPPQPHFDIFLLTGQNPPAGEVLLGFVCGVFFRSDGDHKLVALDAKMNEQVATADLSALDSDSLAQLKGLYPRVEAGEGWFGAAEARAYLRESAARLGITCAEA